jgi:hypothetical protein
MVVKEDAREPYNSSLSRTKVGEDLPKTMDGEWITIVVLQQESKITSTG